MSQNPIVLPTTGTVSGLQLVQDANAALDTLNTKWAGSSPPSSPEPYQDWLDTSTSPPTLRIYDGAEWVAVAQVDTASHAFLPLGSIPTGAVTPFAGAAAPAGWLLCYGQAVSRTTYAALFAAIGTIYGAGDSAMTFNVPDMRGRVAAGVDNMGGSAANRVTIGGSGITGSTLGAAGGNELMQQHSHAVTDPGHIHGVTDPTHAHGPANGNSFITNVASGGAAGGAQLGGAATTAAAATGISVQSHTTGITLANAGSGTSQNMPPTTMLNYIIKT